MIIQTVTIFFVKPFIIYSDRPGWEKPGGNGCCGSIYLTCISAGQKYTVSNIIRK